MKLFSEKKNKKKTKKKPYMTHPTPPLHDPLPPPTLHDPPHPTPALHDTPHPTPTWPTHPTPAWPTPPHPCMTHPTPPHPTPGTILGRNGMDFTGVLHYVSLLVDNKENKDWCQIYRASWNLPFSCTTPRGYKHCHCLQKSCETVRCVDEKHHGGSLSLGSSAMY